MSFTDNNYGMGCFTNVALVARNLEVAEVTASELNQKNKSNNSFAFKADVTDRNSIENVFKEIADKFGGIDVLCASAGTFPQTEIDKMSDEDWDLVIDTNVRGTHWSVKYCLPYLKKAEHGRIILTSSITGPLVGYRGGAQLGYMKSAALELASDNITVNTVMPGNVETDGLKNLIKM